LVRSMCYVDLPNHQSITVPQKFPEPKPIQGAQMI
jgi:hypothetical protein